MSLIPAVALNTDVYTAVVHSRLEQFNKILGEFLSFFKDFFNSHMLTYVLSPRVLFPAGG